VDERARAMEGPVCDERYGRFGRRSATDAPFRRKARSRRELSGRHTSFFGVMPTDNDDA
jgi:hypothetical protein